MHYNDKNIACLKNCKVLIVIMISILQTGLQFTDHYNDKNNRYLPKLTNIQTGLQVTMHYNDKKNRCLQKLANIHSSYRYSDK